MSAAKLAPARARLYTERPNSAPAVCGL